MFKSIILAAMLTATIAVAQDAPKQDPAPRRGAPVVQCEEMKKLMKAVQDHRATCETCKTNLPPRGQFGPGPRGQGQGQGQRRGPGGPPQNR